MRLLTLFLFLSNFLIISGQEMDPVKWTFDINQVGPNEHELIFKANIESPWKVYSQFTGDDGPFPTEITYESGNIEMLDNKFESGDKKEGYDKMFDTDVIAFTSKKSYVIKHKVKVTDFSKPVQGYLTFMTCNNEMCLPPTDVDFKFTIQNSGTVEKKLRDPSGNITDPTIKAPVKSAPQKSKTSASTDQAPSTSNQKETASAANKTQSNNTSTFKLKESPEPTKTIQEKPATTFKIADNIPVSEESSSSVQNSDEPVSWSFDIKKVGGDEYDLIYTANLKKDWTVYSLFTDDNGPFPTSITYETEVETNGKPTEIGKKKEGPDPLFDNVNVIKYLDAQPFVITQRITSNDQAPISGYLTYMACDKKGCLPPTDVEFVFDVKNLKAGVKSTTPISNANPIAAPLNASADIGMKLDGNVLDQRIPQLIDTYANPKGDCGTQIQDANASYWKIFIGGFLGGLVAILLPCIFPMIPITVSYFTKDTKKKGWVNGLVYGLSIVGIFVGLGLLLTALLGPTALNELSTNKIANVIFFLIFVAFAISFFGYYEIALPSSWSTKTDQMADKGGMLGTFFMAATLAIVSFSCTGPIIGSALVQVASDKLGPFFIMLGFSIALAIPFGLFAAFPAWLNSLPKSGSWMNSVKVVLGFLELALALKFLSVADMTSNWGFLRYELFMGLWVIIFAAMTAYLFGFIKFPHDSPVKKLSNKRKIFAFLSLAWTIYIASGFMVDKNINSYMIPKAVSGITPPASYNFFLKQNTLDEDIKKKYPSYSKCANDINCFKDYYEALAYANEVNKPLLLDFTGYGCVNCRKTEDYIWKDPKIQQALNEDFVLASLYVDDRKKLEATLLSKSRDVKLRNIGNKWADFQIVNFKQNSQPLYVPIDPNQKVLTPPRGYEEGVDNYKQFLDCSMDIFKKDS